MAEPVSNNLRKLLRKDVEPVLCQVCRKHTGQYVQKGAAKITKGWCRIHARNLPPVPEQTGTAYMNPWVDNPKRKGER